MSDCATVLRGLERGPKWCTAARRPHADVWRRIWDCFRDIGDEAHVDSVTKCKAHLSKSKQAKVDDAGHTVLQRNHLEQLHRQAAAEASHGSEATQPQILVPDGATKHLPQEARDCLKKAADLYEEERKAEAAAKEAAARPAKEAMELDEFGGALTIYCKLKPEATRRDWQSCGRRLPEI